MNFKDAFRYQKALDVLISNVTSVLNNKSYITKVTETHKRHDANPEAEDMVIDVESENDINIDRVIRLAEALLDEKEGIGVAIARAKKKVLEENGVDMDTMLSVNSARQHISKVIRHMVDKKPVVGKRNGFGYKFNVEGNQVSYMYEIDVEEKDNYDRDEAKKILSQQLNLSDRISNEIELIRVNTAIDFTPKFDVNDSFDDILGKF